MGILGFLLNFCWIFPCLPAKKCVALLICHKPLHFQLRKLNLKGLSKNRTFSLSIKNQSLLFPMSILIGSQFHICECYRQRLTKYLNMILKEDLMISLPRNLKILTVMKSNHSANRCFNEYLLCVRHLNISHVNS